MTVPDVIDKTSPISDKLEACRYVRWYDDSQDFDETKHEACYLAEQGWKPPLRK